LLANRSILGLIAFFAPEVFVVVELSGTYSTSPSAKWHPANMDVTYLNEKINELIRQKGHLLKRDSNTKEVALSSKWKAEINASNTCGSTAGAGSGDFHLFKIQRRQEMFRLKRMYDELQHEIKEAEWLQQKRTREEKEETKAERRRRKRQKQKLRRKSGDVNDPDDSGNKDGSSSSDENGESDSDKDAGADKKPTPKEVDPDTPLDANLTTTSATPSTTEATAATSATAADTVSVEPPPYLSECNSQWDWVRINVTVNPSCHMTRITSIQNPLAMDIAAPPKGNLVNKELLAFLTHTLQVAKSSLSIVSGHNDTHKVLQLQSVPIVTLVTKLVPSV
jgi:uncharacterized protein YggU (UPF0235/DUF167 family)